MTYNKIFEQILTMEKFEENRQTQESMFLILMIKTKLVDYQNGWSKYKCFMVYTSTTRKMYIFLKLTNLLSFKIYKIFKN